jgi:glycosyltransferase involved in cell wall biosynthesis
LKRWPQLSNDALVTCFEGENGDARIPVMIRTAFILPDRARWTGGYQYFVNLFRALSRYGRKRVRPVVFVPDECPTDVLEPLQGDIAEVVRFATNEIRSPLSATLLTGVDRRALSSYRKHDVQVVFESATWHGWRFPLPLIAWLPDFQHRRLSGMFGWRAWLHRELGFHAQVSFASAVMLSSESARSDCEELYPRSLGRTEVIPFAVEPGEEAFRVSETEVRSRYELAAPYFYLPNQYWRHKNHVVIIEALRILRDRNVSVMVVASGSSVDPRHPRLFDELVEHARGLGLSDAFRFLRFVPRADLYALMRGSVAVVNPSLFEGWSTTVEEAKAIGVPLVLSDIAVHREQTGGNALYFDPHSAKQAAVALGEAFEQARGSSSTEPRAQAQARNAERLKKYAFQFEDLVDRLAR